jgi:hypothetical protein
MLLWFAIAGIPPTAAQNLLSNPDAEDPLVSGEIPDWTEVDGTDWQYRDSNPTAQSGQNYFFAGVSSSAELRQDVDVSAQASDIDTGDLQFTFTGYVRSFGQSSPDEAQVILEYRDGSGTVLDTYDSGATTNTSSWLLLSDERTAPVGTRVIRVRLITDRNNGSNNDGYFDNLSLQTSGIIPVELTTFEAATRGTEVQLRWTTASETNNAGFDVERSVDGQAFSKVGFLPGSGTTTEAQRYRFMDDEVPFANTVRYRLKQVDLDGTFAYSDVVRIDITPHAFRLLESTPNPFRTTTRLRYALSERASVEMHLYDVLGRHVRTLVDAERGAGRYTMTLDGAGLAPGTYFVRIRTDTQVETRKVTLVR